MYRDADLIEESGLRGADDTGGDQRISASRASKQCQDFANKRRTPTISEFRVAHIHSHQPGKQAPSAMASSSGSDGSGSCDGKTPGRLRLKRKAEEKQECQSKKAKMIPTPDACSFDEGDEGDYTEFDSDSNRTQPKASESLELLTPRTPSPPPTPKPKHASEARKYLCTHLNCPKSFNRPAKLADHMRSHSGDRPFNCTYDGCDKSFMRRTSLKDHIQSLHTCVRDHACQWEGCDKRFRTSTKLKKHIAIHEGHERFRCTGYAPCNEFFRKHQTLQRHIASVHLGQKPFPCTKIDPITNKPCTQGFTQSTHLRTHIFKYHSGTRFWCHECTAPASGDEGETTEPRKLGFHTFELFEQHKRLVHPPNCALCPKMCSTQSELRRHIEAHHQATGPEKPRAYKCQTTGCGREFTTRSSLKVHVRSVHEQAKPFVCGEIDLASSKIVKGWDRQGACGKEFAAKRTLEEHVRTQHMGLETTRKWKTQGNKSEITGECEKGSSTIAKLTGVGYEESRHIPCLYSSCPNRFIRQYDLEIHMKSNHGLSDGEVVELLVEKEALSGGRFWFGADVQDEEYWDWTPEDAASFGRGATVDVDGQTPPGGRHRENSATWKTGPGLQGPTEGDKLASPWGNEASVGDHSVGDRGSGDDDSETLIDPALRSVKHNHTLAL
ncbi:MAG: Strongly-conserved Zn-finger binding protein (TFIIIA) [Geoglossum umbratile]|nr:MAG: Strongly-conserved Zn-finger binding protein (TFIIIA) [Geoglossum umbratile]